MFFSLLLPLTAAILFHGAGHVLAALACGIRFHRLRATATGFRLVTDQAFPSYRAEAAVALGGPLANLLSAAIAAGGGLGKEVFVPLSLYLALLNLLPLVGFDGGTALSCLLCSLPRALPATAERVLRITSALSMLTLWLIAVYLLLRTGSALSLYGFCLQLFLSIWGEKSTAG